MNYSVAENIKHRSQEKDYSCGAACISMLLDCSESIIRKEVKTNHTGTSFSNVSNFLERVSIPHHFINFKKDINYDDEIINLVNVSFKFPIFIAGFFYSKYYKVGRMRSRCHAVLLCDGLFYDPAEPNPLDFKSFRMVANKNIVIDHLIIVDVERPHFVKKHSNFFGNAGGI